MKEKYNTLIMKPELNIKFVPLRGGVYLDLHYLN